jgi:phosphomannomutase
VGFEFCRNGDTSVTVALRARQAAGDNWTRGGEFTGHQVDLEWLSSGDGIRVAAWVAALAANRGQNFGEMAQEMPLWPEIMKKIKRVSGAGSAILEHSAVIEAVGEAERAIVASGGRLLVRASGTEIKVVRAWGVGPDESLIARNLQMVRSAASQYFELAA